jgi:hypothetical protein
MTSTTISPATGRHRQAAWPADDPDDAPTQPLPAVTPVEERERTAHRDAVDAQDHPTQEPGYDWAALAVGTILLVGAMYLVIALLRWWI